MARAPAKVAPAPTQKPVSKKVVSPPPRGAAKLAVAKTNGEKKVVTDSDGNVVKTEAPKPKTKVIPRKKSRTERMLEKAPTFKIAPVVSEKRDKIEDHWLKMLVYAKYGVGKTYLAGTAVEVPSMCPVLLLNAEKGHLTLASGRESFKHIQRIDINDYEDFSRVTEYVEAFARLRELGTPKAMAAILELERHFRGDPSLEEPTMWRTVIIDSLSEIDRLDLNALIGSEEDTPLDEELPAEEWGEFKMNKRRIESAMRKYRNMAMHVIFICARNWTEETKAEVKTKKYAPALTGQLSQSVQGFVDIVGHLTLSKVEGASAGTRSSSKVTRRLHVQATGKWDAKCRFSAYDRPHFDNPTMRSILEDVGILHPDTVVEES